MRNTLIALTLALAVISGGCAAKQRHYAVAADYAFSVAVGLVDDAVFTSCENHTIKADVCNGKLKTTMINLDTSVKAASTALRSLPEDAPMPTSIPDLLSALHSVQATIAALGDLTAPGLQRVVALIGSAVDSATQLLYIFTPAPAAVKGAR